MSDERKFTATACTQRGGFLDKTKWTLREGGIEGDSYCSGGKQIQFLGKTSGKFPACVETTGCLGTRVDRLFLHLSHLSRCAVSPTGLFQRRGLDAHHNAPRDPSTGIETVGACRRQTTLAAQRSSPPGPGSHRLPSSDSGLGAWRNWGGQSGITKTCPSSPPCSPQTLRHGAPHGNSSLMASSCDRGAGCHLVATFVKSKNGANTGNHTTERCFPMRISRDDKTKSPPL